MQRTSTSTSRNGSFPTVSKALPLVLWRLLLFTFFLFSPLLVNNFNDILAFATSFNRTLCGDKWVAVFDPVNNIGGNTGGRSGCCGVGSYMIDPYADPFNSTDGSATCGACPQGWYGSNQPNADIKCSVCPTGTSNAGTNNDECSACPAGKVVVTTSPLNCSMCGAGTYVDSPTAHLDSTLKCETCPLGRYLTSDGIDNTQHVTISSCKQCPKGFEYTSVTTPCNICPGGRYQISGTSDDLACTLCPIGRFNNDKARIEQKHYSMDDCGK